MTDDSKVSVLLICDCLSKKPDMFAHKLKFILLPQLIATLNNYACSLPPLANPDWSACAERSGYSSVTGRVLTQAIRPAINDFRVGFTSMVGAHIQRKTTLTDQK